MNFTVFDYIELLKKISLKDLEVSNAGVFTERLNNIKDAPTIGAETMPVYNKIAAISAVLERMDARYLEGVRSVPIHRVVACTEYALAQDTSASISEAPIVNEIMSRYMQAEATEVETLESTMLALGVIALFFLNDERPLSDSRVQEIEAYAKGAVPVEPINEQVFEPQRVEPQPDYDDGVIATLEDLKNKSLGGSFENLYEYVKSALENALKVSKDCVDEYKELEKKVKKNKKVEGIKAIKIITKISDYYFWESCVIPGLSTDGDTSITAVKYKKFFNTQKERNSELNSIKEKLLKNNPKIEPLITKINLGADFKYDLEDEKCLDYRVLCEKYASTTKINKVFNLAFEFEKIGDEVSEAYSKAGEIFYNVYQQEKKQNDKYNGSSVSFGEFDKYDKLAKAMEFFAKYFISAYSIGGGEYNRCLYLLFYVYASIAEFDFIKELYNAFIKILDSSKAERAFAEFVSILNLLGAFKGIKKTKSDILSKILRKSKPASDDDDKKANITKIIYLAMVALVSVGIPFFANTPQDKPANAVLCALFILVGSVLTLTAQLFAQKFSCGDNRLFKTAPIIGIAVAFAVHVLSRYVMHDFYAIKVWPGTAGNVFGPSFAVALAILLPCCFLGRTNYYIVKNNLLVNVTQKPVVGLLLLLLLVYTRYGNIMGHFELTLNDKADIFMHAFYGVAGLVFLIVLFFSKKVKSIYFDDINLIFLLYSLVSAFMLAGALLSHTGSDLAAQGALDTMFRIFNMHVPFMFIARFSIDTSAE